MSVFNDLERDFCKRTLSNLNVINEISIQRPDTVYETTQLINSLLGIVINVKEKRLTNSNYMSFTGLYGLQLDNNTKTEWGLENLEYNGFSVGNLLYDLRNSLAHMDFEFMSENKTDISSVSFKFDAGTSKKGCISLSIDSIRKLVYKICKYVEEN